MMVEDEPWVLHPDQECVLKVFMEGRDVFMCLPTGNGKSLCYWFLPRAFDCLK